MDQLKNLAGKVGGNSSGTSSNNAAAGGQKEDYADKGKPPRLYNVQIRE